jgi:membrane protein DedA with SNARE-associated domain
MFDWITSVITSFGYPGVALLTFLENVFPPIPSELIIPLAGFVAANGTLRLDAVIIAATGGSLTGAWLWYEVGRRVGERRLRTWVDNHGAWLTLSADDVDRAQQWFQRRGRAAVLVGRLVPGVRTFVSLPAGFAGMARWVFLLNSALGTAIWTGALAYAGVLLQANYRQVGDYINVVTNGLLAGFGVLMLWRYVRCWRSSRHHRAVAR